jgi:hypothetical protein
MIQILEIVFPRKANIGDLKYLFKIFSILILLAIINPEVWVILLGCISYFIYLYISSQTKSCTNL